MSAQRPRQTVSAVMWRFSLCMRLARVGLSVDKPSLSTVPTCLFDCPAASNGKTLLRDHSVMNGSAYPPSTGWRLQCLRC
jgi:hypothetical protein